MGSGFIHDDFRALWSISTGDPRVCVAVIDGSVDTAHPCFRGVRLSTVRIGVASECTRESAACAHGTFVASVIFGSHTAGGLRGIAPGCRGTLLPVFTDDPRRAGALRPCTQSDLARAIRAGLAQRADVINISAGQLVAEKRASPDLAAAVAECERRGVLVVSAAGNDGCDCLHMPAGLPGVLVVGSTDRNGNPSSFSNFASAYATRGVTVRGEDVLGAAAATGGYARKSGTSSAAPVVSGLAALLMSIWLQRGVGGEAGLSVDVRRRVRDAILNSVRPCDLSDRSLCHRLLSGRVQPLRALQLLLEGDLSVKHEMGEQGGTVQDLGNGEEANEAVGLSCAGKPNCSCGCGSGPTANGPESEEEEEEEEGDPGHADEQIAPNARGVTQRSAPSPGRREGRAAPDRPNRADPVVRRVAPGSLSVASRRVLPSACQDGSCGSGGGGLAYALGELGFDFGTQARWGAINAEMDEGKYPSNPRDLLEFLQKKGNAHFVASIIWTLNHDLTPIYAIRPEGPFARETYDRILEFFADQLSEKAHRVSVPGIIDGTTSLQSGQTVPVLLAELRGMYNWTTAGLLKAVLGEGGDGKSKAARQEGLANFLERVYYDVRNMGQLPEERALNFAATNAFLVERIFEIAAKDQMQLDEVGVDRSPVCRPDSDCWDVRLVFFSPADVMGTARKVFRFSVDVSDVVPVLVGPTRSWSIR